ncbi:hypothetical protein F5880DRAFT_1580610 [Lentinula raphanica]|nr:hypothetical protein F5880DRAFT_1580610 [Lentinula raphanica]
MVSMTSPLLSTLGVTILFCWMDSISLAYPISVLSAESIFVSGTAVYVTESVQHMSVVSSSSTPPTPTLGTIDWGIFVLPPEETSTITNLITVTVPALPFPTSTSTIEVVVTQTVLPSSVVLGTTTTIETVTITPSTSPTPTQATTWTAPAQMTDLSAFNITNFAGGSQNLRIVDNLSANDSSQPSDVSEAVSLEVSDDYTSSNDSLIVSTNATSALQILYPENSIDPAQKPQGGAEFYAVPLDITQARNVTLEYSVFFPEEFDWVLGGKLPGLYGGHQGCSGGDAALDCFSTRLMWRSDGKGELYLYAPKDKQTESLCNNSQSVCDAAYGLSIGRGSFVFAPGNWTTVRQTVTLNTPGQQDGCFTLDVNGQRVIDRNDIYYRGTPMVPSSTKISNDSKNKASKTTSTHPSATPTMAPPSPYKPLPPDTSDGGLFGSGGLLGGILKRDWLLSGDHVHAVVSENTENQQQALGVVDDPNTGTTTDDDDDSDDLDDPSSFGDALQGHSGSTSQPAGFVGLFFRYS